MDPGRPIRDDAGVGVHVGAECIEQAQEDQFATSIEAVLERGWCADFEAARTELVALLETSGERLAQRALCRALLSLSASALGDLATARRLARQAIHDTARPGMLTPHKTLLVLRYARALATRSSALVGDRVRAHRAAQARFVAGDPESRWLMTADEGSPWHDAPMLVRGFARFVDAVEREYAKRPAPSLLSPTEVAILRSVEGGSSASQIAKVSGRSAHTVRTHLRNAYAKLGAHGQKGALVRARELGILQV
jgi:DNA-binding CsgD family transcriptional regulator